MDTIFFGSFCKAPSDSESVTYQFVGDKTNSFGDLKLIEDKANSCSPPEGKENITVNLKSIANVCEVSLENFMMVLTKLRDMALTVSKQKVIGINMCIG